MNEKKSNVLSILSLIFGVVGLILTVIFVGVFLSIAGLILGIISLVEHQSKGMAITGIVCSAMSILFAIVILAFPTVPTSGTVERSTNTTESVEDAETDDETLADMIATELYYYESMGDTFVFVVATNNSENTVDIDTNVIAKDSDGNIIATYSFTENAIGPKESYPLWHYFEGVSTDSIDKIDYTLTATNSSRKSVVDSLKCTINGTNDSGVIITVENSSEEDIYYPKAYALFLQDDNLVGFGETYLDNVSSDCVLQSGKSVTKTIEYYSDSEFDDVKVFYHASAY